MKYKKLPIEKKREIVEEVMLEKNIAEVARKHGIGIVFQIFRNLWSFSLFSLIFPTDILIKKAHKLQNNNPLSHSYAALIDNNNSSHELVESREELDGLIFQYAAQIVF